MTQRVGIGYDIHALKKGRKLILGGIEIPFSRGLVGHSDGDVLFHAIVDAVLGAMGEGDIGQHFPNHDPRFKGVSGAFFVSRVKKILGKKKLKVVQVDSTVIAQEPNLSAYKARMRSRVAAVLGLRASQVNVKAKTNEGFGPIGQGRAIACYAVVSLTGEGKRKKR